MPNLDADRTIISSHSVKLALRRVVAPILVVSLLAACTGNPGGSLAQKCSSGLDKAYRELDIAKANGFSGTVDWAKAASLLAAAKVQYEFEHYPNCIEKVDRARLYIDRSKGG